MPSPFVLLLDPWGFDSLVAGAAVQLVPVDNSDAAQKWVVQGPFVQSAMSANLVLSVPDLGRQGTTVVLAAKELVWLLSSLLICG